MKTRNVIRKVTGTNQVDGAGVHIVRVVGFNDTHDFDPFLMLDAFDTRNPNDYIAGFPLHPHRGIETVTYLVQGKIVHKDSLGNHGTISDGQCQWMTAGSGILHEEMPQATERLFGLQLWVNLPQANKMTQPHYYDIQGDMIHRVDTPDATALVVSGSFDGKKGVAEGRFVKVLMMDVTVKPGHEFTMQVDPEATLFTYILEGKGFFGADSSHEYSSHSALLFDKEDNFMVRAGVDPVRFMLFSGRPLGEPIAWGGPIVMNTREELSLAFDELHEGTFIRNT